MRLDKKRIGHRTIFQKARSVGGVMPEFRYIVVTDARVVAPAVDEDHYIMWPTPFEVLENGAQLTAPPAPHGSVAFVLAIRLRHRAGLAQRIRFAILLKFNEG